jgi:hypothetical protein
MGYSDWAIRLTLSPEAPRETRSPSIETSRTAIIGIIEPIAEARQRQQIDMLGFAGLQNALTRFRYRKSLEEHTAWMDR